MTERELPPKRTAEQLQAAGTKSVKVRKARANVRAALKRGALDLPHALNLPVVQGMKLRAVLSALPGIGGRRADAAMRYINACDGKTVKGMGPRQMERLMDWYGKEVKHG